MLIIKFLDLVKSTRAFYLYLDLVKSTRALMLRQTERWLVAYSCDCGQII